MRTLLPERLRSHRLSAPAKTVTDAAANMLAVQSQDFIAGRWALAARTRGAVGLRRHVDAAFNRGELVRAWTMRGTLHIVPARDLAWVIGVTSGRQSTQAGSRHRLVGADAAMLRLAERTLRPALHDGGCTRAEAFALLDGAGIDPREQRGIHLLFLLTINGVICQGPIVEAPGGVSREQLFVLVEEHVQEHSSPADPLAELFVRYIAGHGPAGVADFAWWSGLTLTSAREAAERASGQVRQVEEGLFLALDRPRRAPNAATVYALPAFEEYYISYADRTPVCAPEQQALIGPGKNGMVRPILLSQGRVAGAWSHSSAVGRHTEAPSAEVFDERMPPDEVAAALQRYADFVTG